jgi:hypothetical protein
MFKKFTRNPKTKEYKNDEKSAAKSKALEKKRGHLRPSEGGNQPDWSSN